MASARNMGWLSEIIAKRIGLKHVFYNDFETDELRDYLGVPVGGLGPFAAFAAGQSSQQLQR